MAEPLVVIGAGGFGREIVDVVRAINASADKPRWDLVGVVDDAPSTQNLMRLDALGVPYLGPVGCPEAGRETPTVIGVGAPSLRRSLWEQLASQTPPSPVLIHPSAVVGSQQHLGDGTVVCAHVSVGTNVTLGAHVHLNPHAVVGHDAALGDFVSVNPNATVSGECVIHQGTLIGAGAVVLQGLTVGAESLVGASACVTRPVPGGAVVMGVPAR